MLLRQAELRRYSLCSNNLHMLKMNEDEYASVNLSLKPRALFCIKVNCLLQCHFLHVLRTDPPMRGVASLTGSISPTMVAKIVMESIIATPEMLRKLKENLEHFRIPRNFPS